MPANLSTIHPKPAPFSPTPLARLKYGTRTKRTDRTHALIVALQGLNGAYQDA